MYISLPIKHPLFFSGFNETWTFPTDPWKQTQISNFMKIRPVEAELFHADRRTDELTDGENIHDEGKSPFRNFAKGSKM